MAFTLDMLEVGLRSHFLEVTGIFIREDEGNKRYLLVKCDCGTEKLMKWDTFRRGRVKSCGCWKKKVDAEKAHMMGTSNEKHGMARTRIYKTWDSMIQRCTNPNCHAYENYGGRGITVCESWMSFTNFYNDMKDGYEDHLTIERKDVNGNYCKENCTWITLAEQQKNKRTSKLIIP